MGIDITYGMGYATGMIEANPYFDPQASVLYWDSDKPPSWRTAMLNGLVKAQSMRARGVKGSIHVGVTESGGTYRPEVSQ